jgi:hypothetical protein
MTMRKSRRRFRSLLLLLLLLLLALLAIGWSNGTVARTLVYAVQQLALPHRAGKELSVERIGWEEPSGDLADGRIRLSISRARAVQALAAAGISPRWAPPGLLRNGLRIAGTWTPYSHDVPVGITIPVEIGIDDTNGNPPRLAGRLPASLLNAYMDAEFAEDYVNEGEDYFLGHYDYVFWPSITDASIRSAAAAPAPPAADDPPPIILHVRANGTAQLKFRENWFRTSTDATLSSLHLILKVTAHKEQEGIILDYSAHFANLRSNVRKLHSIGDKQVSETLQKKWERSLNKEKRRQKLARHPLPHWAPLDLVVDIAFLPEGGEP